MTMGTATRRHSAAEPDNSPAAKRKKVRRGTHSCWECKRRKMKCVLERPDDAICIGCHRRGTKCVSQELPEEASAPLDSPGQLRERLRRVEAQLDRFLTHADAGIPTPASSEPQPVGADEHPPFSSRGAIETHSSRRPFTGWDDAAHGPPSTVAARPEAGPHGSLSRTLWEALPSQQDVHRISQVSGRYCIPFHEVLTTPPAMLEQDGLRSQHRLLEVPGRQAHPVLIARHMLYLASFLQHLQPDGHEEIRSLSEPLQDMRDRLAETATSLVTSKDAFVGSIEYLECVMIESLYQADCGFLRRSWMTARRAMVIAQSMGFHRSGSVHYQALDPDSKADPHFMWFRIVFYDRQMCLILGMPQGTLDRSMASDATPTQLSPAGCLERIHCVIASRILERNETSPESWQYASTQAIEQELQRAARTVPNQWWLMPNLGSQTSNPQALFWEMRQLSEQLCHYNLLNQLHLPYMLRHAVEDRREYSRLICVNASREILSRFIMLRRWNRVAFSCRTIDFTALMAAITLLLAHLESHRSPPTDNFLVVQYPGDRAMIEKAQEDMEGLDRVNEDPLSARSAGLLRHLLAIEAKAADGDLQSALSLSVQASGFETPATDESTHDGRVAYIPYFGVIKTTSRTQQGNRTTAQYSPKANYRKPRPEVVVEREMQTQPALPVSTPPSLWPSSANSAAIFAPLLSTVISEDSLEQPESPDLTGRALEYSFDNMDLAFLNNLVRGVGDIGDIGADWTGGPGE
ncbi:hypothetical protein P170DRAFT_433405 [Aspergillus steynii IBT 23096]|uniref:Zn(2)-C6 fungal-type domain-containing protein n=1 Tax=Aspergillus steynii IBT 23096 TaxID=1392250 RepID=A0A2I2GET0_9EURO|nr:uncharacterized protein P170DRAFT_433405 [Aspergillus steynii IBT 23096]PLB51398.1 hypothetical protein P170DRAFT_433405 [Aspergillus steynii IBT 23096]